MERGHSKQQSAFTAYPREEREIGSWATVTKLFSFMKRGFSEMDFHDKEHDYAEILLVLVMKMQLAKPVHMQYEQPTT